MCQIFSKTNTQSVSLKTYRKLLNPFTYLINLGDIWLLLLQKMKQKMIPTHLMISMLKKFLLSSLNLEGNLFATSQATKLTSVNSI